MDPAQAPDADRRRWLGLIVIGLGISMIIVDATIVNVAVPAIIRDLHLTSTDAQWVNEVYALVFAALLLTWGRLADRVGRRRVFLAGVAVFVVASLLAAISGSAVELIGARVLQGVGGAMILPTTLSLLNATFRGKDRALAFAVWGSTIGGTAALGPLLGGWLTTTFSWRWAFGVNLPLGLLVFAGGLVLLRESRERTAARGADLLGALLSVLGFGSLVFALIEGRSYGWWRLTRPFDLAGVGWPGQLSPVAVAAGVAVVTLGGFVAWERARGLAGRVVLLDLQLFRITSFRNGNIAAMIVSLGEFGLLFALPLWFQNVRGYSAFETGLALLPLATGSFVASGVAALLARRRGPALVVRLGILAETVGIALVGVVISPTSAWWVSVPFLFVYGLGVGLATAQLTGVVLAEVPVDRGGQASGTQSTTRQVGSALGIAVLGTLLFTSLAADLTGRLEQRAGLPPAQAEQVARAVRDSAGAAISGLAAQPGGQLLAQAARDSFTRATRWTAFGAAGFLALGLLSTVGLSAAGVTGGGETGGEAEGETEGEVGTTALHHDGAVLGRDGRVVLPPQPGQQPDRLAQPGRGGGER